MVSCPLGLRLAELAASRNNWTPSDAVLLQTAECCEQIGGRERFVTAYYQLLLYMAVSSEASITSCEKSSSGS